MTITPHHQKLLDAAASIGKEPDAIELAFMARQLVQATLPHRNPGDIPLWTRKNGNLTLSIQSGINLDAEQPYGYPYGTIPRLLLFWLTTEAVRTKNRRIELGNSLAAFMQELGLNSRNGGTGARRSDAGRLKNQMERLFFSRISFHYKSTEGNNKGHAWMHMEVAPKGELWWDFKCPENASLFESWVMLGEDFYQSLVSSPVPMDMRVLKALKQSPLALDLYAWSSHAAYIAKQQDEVRSVSWELLQQQFGGDYDSAKEFARNARLAFKKIEQLCPTLYLSYVRGGVQILPAQLVAAKPEKPKRPAAPAPKDRSTMPKLAVASIEEAKTILLKAGTGWNVYYLEEEFYRYAAKKGIPDNVHTAFLGFVRQKAKKRA